MDNEWWNVIVHQMKTEEGWLLNQALAGQPSSAFTVNIHKVLDKNWFLSKTDVAAEQSFIHHFEVVGGNHVLDTRFSLRQLWGLSFTVGSLFTKVLLFCALQEEKGDPVPEASWPENGDQWSDGESGGELEESGLIQEMVEEDEDIDLYNEETFGLGQVASLVVSSRLNL